MRKPWSISTTVRNPERIKQFLSVLKTLENKKWDEENQKKFQILLIQNRLYGNNNTQFLNGLSLLHVELLKDFTKKIEYGVAEKIFYAKDYEDPAMRGRQSINPLKKLGFVSIIDGKIIFNDIANRMIKDEADIGDVFFRCFLKCRPSLGGPVYHRRRYLCYEHKAKYKNKQAGRAKLARPAKHHAS